ncbi:hypothetical protein D3C86_1824560 [compost metagenome]
MNERAGGVDQPGLALAHPLPAATVDQPLKPGERHPMLAKAFALAQLAQGVAHQLGHQRPAQTGDMGGEEGLLQQLLHLWQAMAWLVDGGRLRL